MIDASRQYTTIVRHIHGVTKITLLEYPGPEDWMEVYRRALICENKTPKHPPTSDWIARMLDARHSPIRRAMYAFLIEDIPSNTSTHFARHVHAQPYISSLRTDRVSPEYLEALRRDFGEIVDSDHAPRMTPVGMILDVNAEELQEMANKRLCQTAAEVTRRIMEGICELARNATPEIKKGLVPRCIYCGGVCHEYKSCGLCEHY